MNRAHVEYIAAMLIFGFNGVLASAIPWRSYEIVLSRTVIGSLFMLAVMLIRKRPFVFRQEMKSFKILMVSGIAMGFNWMCLYEAYNQLGVGLAQLICCSGPAVAMFLSPFIFKEKLRGYKMLGFAAVAFGMLLTCSNDLSGGLNFGLLCGIGACLGYAALNICNRLAPAIEGPERTMWQLAMASVVVFIFILCKGTGAPDTFSVKILIPVLVLGMFNTGFAMNFMFAGIQKLSSQTVGVCGYLEPMSALVFSALFLGERMTPLQMVGVVLMLGGTAFAELYRPRNKSTKIEA